MNTLCRHGKPTFLNIKPVFDDDDKQIGWRYIDNSEKKGGVTNDKN